MKKIFIAATFLMSLGVASGVTGALADDGSYDGFDPANVILANATDQPMTSAPYVSEQEAKLWVLNAGYNQVSGLTRDQHALYHGTALLDGETYDIVVDAQGNIVGAKE